MVVIHPHHGPARVLSVGPRNIRGRRRRYVELESLDGKLGIAVPCDAVDRVGLRAVLSPRGVDRLLALLNSPGIPLEAQWSRRMKAMGERLASGRLEEIAVVVRELGRRAATTRSMSEREMQRTAKSHLAVEIALALGIDVAAAERVVDDAVTAAPGTVSPSRSRTPSACLAAAAPTS
jgi:CarD family transcriptional regulator